MLQYFYNSSFGMDAIAIFVLGRSELTTNLDSSIIKITMYFIYLVCMQIFRSRRRIRRAPTFLARRRKQTTNQKWMECQRRTRNTGDEITGSEAAGFVFFCWPGAWGLGMGSLSIIISLVRDR